MLSSKFLVVSFLYVFYATGVVAADLRKPFGGGNPLCQSVQTVTVTVTPGQPSSSSRPANNNVKSSSSLPVVTTRPGNVNLATSTSVNKNTKTSSIKTSTSTSSINTITSSVKNVNTKNVKTSTKSVNTKNVNTSTKINVVNSSSKSVNTNTKNVNTKTSVLSSSTGLPSTSLPPASGTGRSLAVSPSSTAAPPANTDTGNPDTSLTLDPSVIQNINGKGQAAGEADSLVSTNDFIGFCVGKTITNGKQVQTGSCNPVPMGDIPSVDNMPSAKFNSPKNFDTIAANTAFTISLQVRNFGTGTFTNAANTYYAAPQQLVGGLIQGHSHVTVQKMASLGAPDPLNPKVFDFFKGLNAAAVNGALTADVTKGLPAGVYRISSINSAGNHQEALGPVAQRGSFNDVVYITVTDGGANANSVSSPAVDPTATGVSSVLSSTVSPPAPSSSGKGGKDTVVSSSVIPPVSTSGGGKNGGKGGNVVSTSTALPKSTPPPVVSGKKDTVVSSSAKPPVSTPAKGTPGGNGNGGGNKQNQKRMHKRSAHA